MVPGLAGVSAAEATHTPLGTGLGSQIRELAVYLDWGTGTVSGAITVETAHALEYTGTWAPLVVVPFAGTAPKEDVIQITGIFGAIRTRVSTVLAGGTVKTWFVGN